MKKVVKSLAVAMSFALIFAMSVPAFAVTVNGFSLPSNQIWVSPGDVSRSTQYPYVIVRCDAVYPESGIDLFSKVQSRLMFNGTQISNTEIISEGSGDQNLDILGGYAGESRVTIEFRGNTNKAAIANLFYDGM